MIFRRSRFRDVVERQLSIFADEDADLLADVDEALERELAEHAREAHPEDQRRDDALRAHVAERAEEPPDRPPWAY